MRDSLQRRFEENVPAVGYWVSIGTPEVAELIALVGYDFVIIDLEHSTISLETAQHMIYAVEAVDSPTRAIVRVPDDDLQFISRTLDYGASGIIVPRVSSPQQAKDIVNAAYYPPKGRRGLGSSRATKFGLDIDEYVATSRDNLTCVVQIETEAGVQACDDIAAVPGINSLLIGTRDLAQSIGDEADISTEIERIRQAGDTAGVPVGISATSSDELQTWESKGFQYFIVGKDMLDLRDASADALSRADNILER
jgi:2-dehydro-3-deoxyglucarate aldolase/4-hydroxy-2-oxoheptanedioate aldolase